MSGVLPGLLVGLLATTASAVPSDPVAPPPCRAIDRPHDHVELRGTTLRKLNRIPLDRFAVLTGRDGEPVPIPFQIDEKRGHRPTLQHGPGARVDNRPGQFDFDDVVVIMACDLGERLDDRARERMVQSHHLDAWREVRVRDPLTGALGWVYVVVGTHVPRTTRPYVTYGPGDVVRTAAYRLAMRHALPTNFRLAARGTMSRNLLDGLRLRGEAVANAHLARLTLTEVDVDHRLVAWGHGAVRAMRRSKHDISIGLGIDITVGVAHTYFYSRRITGPGKMKLPFSPSYLLRQARVFGGVDMSGLDGWRYHAPGLTTPLRIDGTSSELERRPPSRGTWFVLARDDVAMLVVARLGDTTAAAVDLKLAYTDDAVTPRPPERRVGVMPLVGFQAADLHLLEAGRYVYALEVLFLNGYRPGDEVPLLARLGAPLEPTLTAPARYVAARATRP